MGPAAQRESLYRGTQTRKNSVEGSQKATRQVHVAGYGHAHFPQASGKQNGRPFDVDSRINLALANRSAQLIVDEGQRSLDPLPRAAAKPRRFGPLML